jgi:8-oxo-dGTP diphosphatase
VSEWITAAGGLVFATIDGKRRVLVIHRPRYDDWSFPKGKHDDGESDEAAALREIQEETNVLGRIVGRLADVVYTTPNDNPKRVNYFAVRAVRTPKFKPNSEVDRLEWLSAKEARTRLTYEHDRKLLESVSLKRLDATGQVHLLRHAAAGDRSEWNGDDRKRPLNEKGRLQAAALADSLAHRMGSAILSSPYVRCIETGEPLAAKLGLSVTEAEFLEEGSGGRGFTDYVEDSQGLEIVMVSHGDVIPAIVDQLGRRGVRMSTRSPDGRLDCKKASNWILTTEYGRIVSAEYVPPPEV